MLDGPFINLVSNFSLKHKPITTLGTKSGVLFITDHLKIKIHLIITMILLIQNKKLTSRFWICLK
jgi:hypothetical protein